MLMVIIHTFSTHVCVFNKLHIIAQPGPIILILQYYKYGSTIYGGLVVTTATTTISNVCVNQVIIQQGAVKDYFALPYFTRVPFC